MKSIVKYTPNEKVFIAEVILTTVCNQECEYCICEIPTNPCPTHMEVTQIPHLIKMFKYIKDNDVFGHDGFGISVLGGEPTMYPYLKYLYTELNNLELPLTLITNGTNVEILHELDLSNTTVFATYHASDCDIPFDVWYSDLSKVDAKIVMYNMLSTEYNVEEQIANYESVDPSHKRILNPIDRFPEHESYDKYKSYLSERDDLEATIEYSDGEIVDKKWTEYYLCNEFNVFGFKCETSIIFINELGNVYRCANDIMRERPLFNLRDDTFNILKSCDVVCPYTKCGCGDKNVRYKI